MLNKEKINANKTTKFGCRGGRLCPPANKQNGITLIALIITIIVMLILVGVTINAALNGGIFGKADTATRETEEQAILEEMLSMMEITDDGKFKVDTILERMKEKYTVVYKKPNASITGKLGTYNYIVSEKEIKIGTSEGETVEIPEELKRYILGPDLTGRSIMQIFNFSSFIDDPLTEDVNETETLGVEYLISGDSEDMTKGVIYAKYDNKAYKIIWDQTTKKSEKLEMIYEPKGTEGQTTAEGWTILYDNGTTAEAVSPTAMESLRLGYSETATSETQLKEAIDSYNDAITIINNYCKNELTGLPTNSNVRSVGASSETSDEASNKYTLPKEWNSTYDGVGKKGDTLYEQDLLRMAYHGVLATGTSYWVASRFVSEFAGDVGFYVMGVDEVGRKSVSDLWHVNSSGASGRNVSRAVRPIITIQNP